MDMKRLYRSLNDKMVAGVCGGLGEYFGIDPTLVRLLFVMLALLGGHGVLVYLVMWLVVPARAVERMEAPRSVDPAL